MISDLIYDGQNINWPGKGAFKATSGLPDSQLPKNSCVPDSGPIPEGFYKVFISDQGSAQDDGTGYCVLKPSWGIQEVPSGAEAGDCEPYWVNWGNNRARMEPADILTKNRCSPVMRGDSICMIPLKATVMDVSKLKQSYSRSCELVTKQPKKMC